MESIHIVEEMSQETETRDPNQALGNNGSIVPHLVAGIIQELDHENEIKHVPFLSDLMKLEKKFEISEEMVSNEDVNIQLNQFENFNEVSVCQEVIQPGLCRVDRHIKEEISIDTSEHFTNSQAGVQKIQVENVYSLQHSQFVLADVFTENLPEHIRNIVKNTSDETGDCEILHEHKENTVMKTENKNIDLCLTSREQKLNDLSESVKEQVMVEDTISKIIHNGDTLNVSNGECSKLSENELCVFKKDNRHNVCSVSCENLDNCDYSGVGLTKLASLNTYRKKYGGEKSDDCHVSNLGFNCSENLKSHRNVHTDERYYKCDVCNKGFVCFKAMIRHIDQHMKCKHKGNVSSERFVLSKTRKKSYKYDVCGVGFSETGTLKNHKRTYTGEKPYKCDMCGIVVSRPSYLKRHKRKHTGEKPYKCDVCGVRFTRTSSLNVHKRTHTGEKPYRCDVCGVGFSINGVLKIHKRTHTGERPYKCDVCGVGFSRTGDLKSHKRTHTGQKPYKCDVCGVGYSENRTLKNHKRTHTGEKPYNCDVCGVGFYATKTLKNHKRSHTGEKSYKCDVCGVGFLESGTLKNHKRTHTGEMIIWLPM